MRSSQNASGRRALYRRGVVLSVILLPIADTEVTIAVLWLIVAAYRPYDVRAILIVNDRRDHFGNCVQIARRTARKRRHCSAGAHIHNLHQLINWARMP